MYDEFKSFVYKYKDELSRDELRFHQKTRCYKFRM